MKIITFLKRKLFRFLIRIVFPLPQMTIISSNCLGARIYKEANSVFNSPTIDLWFYPDDFIKFVKNIDHYLSCELLENKAAMKNYPCGTLGDITLNLQHYTDFDSAKLKWDVRKKRIIKDRTVIFFTDRDGATNDHITYLLKSCSYPVFIFVSDTRKIQSSEGLYKVSSRSYEVGDLYSNYDALLKVFPFRRISKIFSSKNKS